MVENQDLRSTHYLIQNKKIHSGKARVLQSQLHTYIFLLSSRRPPTKEIRGATKLTTYIITFIMGETFVSERNPRKEQKDWRADPSPE